MAERNFILFVYEREMATVELMREGFNRILKDKKTMISFKKSVLVQPKDIDRADVLVMIRPHDQLSYKITKKARKTGCFIVFFMDDDMFHYPAFLHSIPWRMRVLKKVLKLSDVLLTSNVNILKKYKRYTVQKKGIVSHSSVSEAEIEVIPKKRGNASVTKLVYAAGSSHAAEIGRYILPVLNYLNRHYGGEISMTFIGIKPEFDLKKYRFDIEYVEPMKLDEYRKWMLDHQYDIGFAPLENTWFNNNKYFNKWLEYTLTGVVGIYSNCQPYTFIVTDGFNGFLADDNTDEWIRKTMLAINHKQLRDAVLENAINQVSEKFSEKNIYEELKSGLPELFARRKKKGHCSRLWMDKLAYRLLLVMDSIYLAMFYLKRMGWRGVIRKTAAHFQMTAIYKA